jgi:hypothetical protein
MNLPQNTDCKLPRKGASLQTHLLQILLAYFGQSMTQEEEFFVCVKSSPEIF